MNKTRTWWLLALSLVLALATVSLAARWLQRRDPMALVPVPVAAQDLKAGARLQTGLWETALWPRTAVAQLGPVAEGGLEGRVLAAAVVRGEPLLAARLAPAGELGGLSALLAPGKRAVTVKVNEIVGVAGFALPGNHVDVMVHAPDVDKHPVSKIVLERITVLAVAQDAAVSENKPRVVNAVTLEVTPEEAERLDLARSVGTLSLVLRSQVDTARVDTPGARKPDLIRLHAEPPQRAPAAVRRSEDRPAAPVQAAAMQGELAPRLQVVRGTRMTLE
jgi:pilus assembly protein CpaB